jgi:hypothetical protein
VIEDRFTTTVEAAARFARDQGSGFDDRPTLAECEADDRACPPVRGAPAPVTIADMIGAPVLADEDVPF